MRVTTASTCQKSLRMPHSSAGHMEGGISGVPTTRFVRERMVDILSSRAFVTYTRRRLILLSWRESIFNADCNPVAKTASGQYGGLSSRSRGLPFPTKAARNIQLLMLHRMMEVTACRVSLQNTCNSSQAGRQAGIDEPV